MTTVPMVFDICIEPHAPYRVMHQFGFCQSFPVPFPTGVTTAVHWYSCKGQQSAGNWPAKLGPFVDDRLLATEEVMDHAGEPHTEERYQAYLRWYQPRTHTRVIFAPTEQQAHAASARDLYARHRDQDFARAVVECNRVIIDASTAIQRLGAGIEVGADEHLSVYTRIWDSMRSILRVLTYHAADVSQVDAAPQVRPRPIAHRPAVHVPRPTPLPFGGFAQFGMTQATHS